MICDMQGTVLYASNDMTSRIHRPLLGEEIGSFLDPADEARFRSFLASADETLVCHVHGIRGLSAVRMERTRGGFYPTLQCTFATKENDFSSPDRGIRPAFFAAAKRELTEVWERSPDHNAKGDKRLDTCIDVMYNNSMLFLISMEMFHETHREKYMSDLSEYLRQITASAMRVVRSLDLTVRLETEGVVEACYDLSSFTFLYLSILAVMNDVSATRAVRVEAALGEDGAYLTLETEVALDGVPPFDGGMPEAVIPFLPLPLQIRLQICEMIGGAFGHKLLCSHTDGRLSFFVDLPHVRRGGLYLKADPLRQQDPDALCAHYLRYLLSADPR